MHSVIKNVDALPPVANFLRNGAFLRLENDLISVWFSNLPESPKSGSAPCVSRLEFWGSEPRTVHFEQNLHINRSTFIYWIEKSLGRLGLHKGNFSELKMESFEKGFQLIQGKIQREEIEKALSICITETEKQIVDQDKVSIILNSLQLPISLNVFGVWDESSGTIGATPEILFKKQDDTVHTMALAGSCPKSEASERMPLLKDPKEIREHKFVVEDLTQTLRPLGWITSEPTKVLELPTLFHLCTEFKLANCKKTPIELMKIMHPTAALGQFPRAYGLSWMRELPFQINRGQFGGPILFEMADRRAIAVVAIRSVFWEKSRVWIGAGCGIVKDSDLNREWRELLAKVDSVYRSLGIE